LKFNENSSYFASVGNFKDNKVAVWSRSEQCLVSSKNVIDIMHELKWKPFLNANNQSFNPKAKNVVSKMEFAVVGKNKITVFEFNCDMETLTIKCEKMLEHGVNDIDLTACDYTLNLRFGWSILVGSEMGHIFLLDAENLGLKYEFSLFESEISSINYNLAEDKLVTTSIEGEIKYMNFNSVDFSDPGFLEEVQKVQLPSGVTAFSLDCQSKEGFATTLEGAIYWVDLMNHKSTQFIQGVDNFNKVVKTLQVNDDMIITIHNNGDAKVWNAQTTEILKEFKWKYHITGAVHVEKLNSILFFLANYNIISMDLADFNKVSYYRIDNVEKLQIGYMLNYITNAIPLEMGESSKYLLVTNRGDTLITDFASGNILDVRKVKFWK